MLQGNNSFSYICKPLKTFKSTTSGFFHGFALAHSLTAQLGMVEDEEEQKQTGAKGYFVCS